VRQDSFIVVAQMHIVLALNVAKNMTGCLLVIVKLGAGVEICESVEKRK